MKLSNKQILSEIEEETSMAMHVSVGRKEMNPECTKVKNMHYHDHWNGRFKNTYRWGIRFLKKNVGRPWNIVYSELCEKIKTDKDILSQYGWENTKESICRYVDINNKRRKYRYNNHYCEDFYVDEHGILRTNIKDKPAHHKDRVQIKHIIGYRFKDTALPYKNEIISHLHRCFSHNIADTILIEDVIPVRVFKILSDFCSFNFNMSIRHILRAVYVKDHPGFSHYHNTYTNITCLLQPVYSITTEIVTKKQRIKNYAESQSKTRSKDRILEQDAKQYTEILLHNIMKERKDKERKENLIKIQAHGMDEKTSFRGEEYHGQKRKKK